MQAHSQQINDTFSGLAGKLESKNTTILGDSFEFGSLFNGFKGTMLSVHQAHEALASGQLDLYIWIATRKVVDICVKKKLALAQDELVSRAMDQLILELAVAFKGFVDGPHIAIVDPRNHADMDALVENAQRLSKMIKEQGMTDQICFTIPATEAGIYAAQKLEKQGIQVNLCMVTSLMHAAACTEAGASTISIPVGLLLDQYERKRSIPSVTSSAHPGIQSIQIILAYFRLNKIRTRVIGTSLRNLSEVGLLSEFDAVCITPEQSERLRWSPVSVDALDRQDHPAVLRAQQAKYPTDLLGLDTGFSSWFSPASRKFASNVLQPVLQDSKRQMDDIEDRLRDELIWQLDLATLPMKALERKYDKKKRELTQNIAARDTDYR
ncbi:hypothetical protein CPB84DRAFT_1958797 [Gymnopilus junonius]|uniref:Transaldolase n=1 Tax=Gymnopilus junonius TaxID=109634 RepID=A0A9P5NX81_GYMJU|nr:hypothetical protein CPB84DRAFT_1958797 [Gymnopilus junonius]